MRFLLLSLLLFSGLAHAELGTSTAPAKAKATQQKPAGYRTSEQDKQYQDRIDGIDKGYKQQTDAINDGKYESYLGKLDSTYDQMVNDINAGGSGRISGELPKFVPTKVPDGTTTGSTATATTAATTATTASTAATSSSEEFGTPQERLIKSYCPNTCAKIKEEQAAYACKTECVHSAMMIGQPKQEDNMQMLMMLASSVMNQ